MNQKKIQKKFMSTATPQEVVFGLLDKLIVNLQRAELAFAVGDYEVMNESLIDSQNILLALAGMMQSNDKSSTQTEMMLEFWAEQLMIANMNRNRRKINEIMQLVKRLKTVYGGYIGKEGLLIK